MWPVVVSSLSFLSHYNIVTLVIFPASFWGSQTTCWSHCGAFEAILLWYKHEKAGLRYAALHELSSFPDVGAHFEKPSFDQVEDWFWVDVLQAYIYRLVLYPFSSQIGLQSPQPGQITPRRYNSNTVQVFQEVWQHVLWYVMWPHAAKTLHRMFSSLIKVILSCHIDVFCSSASGHGNLFETDPPSAFLSFTLCPPGFCPSVSPNIFLFISSSLSSCSLFFFQAWSNKFFLFQGLHFLLSLSLPPLHLISPLSPLSDTSLKPRLSY